MGGEEEKRATWKQCEKYSRLAAEQGDAHSQCDLAGLYLGEIANLDGVLSASDRELLQKAIGWHRKAAAQGNDNSIKRLKELSERFPEAMRSVAT